MTTKARKTTRPAAGKKKAQAPAQSILEQLPPPRTEADDHDTLEFLQAVDAFKRRSGKSFPSYTELLGILKDLGYQKVGRR